MLLTNLEYSTTTTRNRDLEGRDDGQMTFLNFNSYIQNLRFFIFYTDRQTDGQTDGWTEKLIRCGLGNLSVPPGTPAARGLEELFFAVLERFLQPIHALCV